MLSNGLSKACSRAFSFMNETFQVLEDTSQTSRAMSEQYPRSSGAQFYEDLPVHALPYPVHEEIAIQAGDIAASSWNIELLYELSLKHPYLGSVGNNAACRK